ncbi:hypothetical protein [Mucilaginibacter sp.]
MKWTLIITAIIIGVIITFLSGILLLIGLLSFFVVWKRNPDLNPIGRFVFFITIPFFSLGIYILKKNIQYLTGKKSWYKEISN